MNYSGFKIYSHPRSGTNWLLALLEQAFNGTVIYARATTGHWSKRVTVTAPVSNLWGGHNFYSDSLPGPRVYLCRDGRDVALSLWRTKAFQHKSWRRLTFLEFIRRPLDWHATPGARSISRMTIIEHWKRHLDTWRGASGTCFVRYEDLLQHTESEVARIAAFIGREPLLIEDATSGMGPFPSGDYRAAKWRDGFTDADLEYFFSIVPDDHWGLWNE